MKRENSIFLAVPVAALAVNFLFLQDGTYKIPFLSLILLLAGAFAIGVYAEVKKSSADTKKMLLKTGALVLVSLGIIQAVCALRKNFFGNESVLFKWTCILAMVLVYIVILFVMTGGEITEDTVFLVLMAGLCIRAVYVVLTQVHLFQNDAGTMAPNYGGHLGYIYQFYSKGTLPSGDPRWFDQFYHPPLHHMLAGAWLKLNRLLGRGGGGIDELLQSLTLFYAGCTLGFLNKIGIKMKISCRGRCMALGIIGFLPFGIMMSGAVNNDALMILFDVMALYFTLKWFEEPVMKNILLIALTIGCSMMTKLSGGLIAPAVAAVMLLRVWKDRKEFRKYPAQFLGFAAVVFPLGLWYPVKNLIKFGIPITYVPRLGDNVAQYIGNYGIAQRLFGLRGQFSTLHIVLDNKQPDISYNIPVSIIKFLTFGEGRYYKQNPIIEKLGTGMFYFTMAILALALIGTLVWLFLRRDNLHARLLSGLSLLVITVAYFKFCFDYPHVCTMHVRYIMLPVYLCFLGLGGLFSETEENGVMEKAGKGVMGLMLVYAVVSALLLFTMEAGLAA